MQPWMIDALMIVGGGIAIFTMLRVRVTRLEADYRDHILQSDKRVIAIYEKIDENNKANNVRIDAGFKRVDQVSEKVTILERDTANLLDLDTAEAKFVTRKELDLHLDKIEIITGNTNKEVSLLMGKQEDILTLLHEIKENKND